MVKRKALVVELSALTLRIRLKGARWSYEVITNRFSNSA